MLPLQIHKALKILGITVLTLFYGCSGPQDTRPLPRMMECKDVMKEYHQLRDDLESHDRVENVMLGLNIAVNVLSAFSGGSGPNNYSGRDDREMDRKRLCLLEKELKTPRCMARLHEIYIKDPTPHKAEIPS